MTARPYESIWSRPETAAIGRPAERSRAEMTAAAITLADRDGMAAVTMRRVAAAMGTGAASLYRYVKTREELLDLMVDAVIAEYDLSPPGEDWVAGILDIARQTRTLMRRHPWLATVTPLRPMLGPHALDLLEHVLETLAGHPARGTVKLQAFAVLNGVVALLTQHELALLRESDRPTVSEWQARLTTHLRQVGERGRHPRIAAVMTSDQPDGADTPGPPEDQFDTIVTRIMVGLLGPTT